jgi:UPF0716 protein FxsA
VLRPVKSTGLGEAVMWLFALFLAIPLIEIALFIQVGGVIGLWATLAIVILTAILGAALVRSQGAQALLDLRRSMETLNDPTEPLAGGAMILFAGALLLTPGFFTDTVGFALLIPGVRAAIIRRVRSRVRGNVFVYGQTSGSRSQQPDADGEIIDGEAEEVAQESRVTHRPSGWTRH